VIDSAGMNNGHDIQVLRELARHYADIAAKPMRVKASVISC